MKIFNFRKPLLIGIELFSLSAYQFGGHWHWLANISHRLFNVDDLSICIGLPIHIGYSRVYYDGYYHTIHLGFVRIHWTGSPMYDIDCDYTIPR